MEYGVQSGQTGMRGYREQPMIIRLIDNGICRPTPEVGLRWDEWDHVELVDRVGY
jgi:hypothetical protein